MLLDFHSAQLIFRMITGNKHNFASALEGLAFDLSLICFCHFSLASSGFGSACNHHLVSAISKFNALVSPSEVITVESTLISLFSSNKALSKI